MLQDCKRLEGYHGANTAGLLPPVSTPLSMTSLSGITTAIDTTVSTPSTTVTSMTSTSAPGVVSAVSDKPADSNPSSESAAVSPLFNYYLT